MTTPAQSEFALSWLQKRFEDFGRLKAKDPRTPKEDAIMREIANLAQRNLSIIPEPLKSQAFAIQLDDVWTESEAMTTAIADGQEPEIEVADLQKSFAIVKDNIGKLTPEAAPEATPE